MNSSIYLGEVFQNSDSTRRHMPAQVLMGNKPYQNMPGLRLHSEAVVKIWLNGLDLNRCIKRSN